MNKKLPFSEVIVFRKLLILFTMPLVFFANTLNLKAQTFSNTQQTSIPDPGTVSVPITVSSLSNQIDTVTYGLESVSVKITHPTTKELTLKLQSPDGKTIFLFRKSQGKNLNTTFDAVSPQFIDNNEIAGYSGSFTGGYRPRQDLALLNNTQNPNGVWNLIVTDNSSTSTTGTVTSVSLSFGNKPAKPLLASSNLPIIKIYTSNNSDIVDEPKILADIFIINNGDGAYNYANQSTYQYQGKIGIEIRGNSTSSLPTIPKKQYGFETRAADGVTSTDVSLFGMPAQSDWILSAVMSDKSLMRNVLTYQIAREMGKWASRTQYCELMINDEYRGVFIFEEKIKKDKNRVPVDKMTSADIADPNVTGGYIFSIDDIDSGDVSWQTKYDPKPSKPYKFVYPKPADVQPEQKDYLIKYVGDFETALHGNNFQDTVNGFRKYADDKSLIDFFIVNEVGKNADAYRYSTYFYKKRGGKIVAGPVWDFDRSFRNEATCNTFLPSGYIYQDVNNCDGRIVQWWWARLLEDTKYKQDLVCRYNTLRQSTLSRQHLYHIIDSAAAVLNAGAQQRNFIRWNIFGKYVDRIPEPYSATYAIEIDTLKQWINNRLNWLDNDLGTCTTNVPAQYTLTVTAANGTVSKNPNQTKYASGTNVTLTANPAPGYEFSNWSGDASGSTNPLTVTMTDNKSITANFTAIKYTLTATAANGTVSKDPDQQSYASGTDVILTATAASGYQFSNWSGDASGNTNPLTVTMTNNKSITANFTAIKYTLSVASANGTVSKDPDQQSYASGTDVTLTATAASGYQFSNWSGDASGTTNPLTVTMTDNKSITANFTILPVDRYTLSVNSDNGTVSKSPDQSSYENGTDVTLTANPAAGYQFSNWSGDASGTANPLTVTMNGNKNITANFTKLPVDRYTLSITADNGTVSKSPDQSSYESGTDVTLTATPATGYQFSNWSGDASGTANPLTVTMTDDRSITANFTAIKYTLSVTAANGTVSKSPDQSSYTSGTDVTVTATPASGYQFNNWSGDVSGTANPLTVTMNGNKNVTANFTKVTQQQNVTLAPVADAFTRDGSYAGVNYGKDNLLAVKGGPSSGLSRETYLKFSLNNVSNVSSAKLRLYGSNTENSATVLIDAYGVTNDSWTETGITWSNRPVASSTVLSSVNVNTQSKYYELDVTSFAKAQLAGDKTASFLIKDPSKKDTYLTFNSKENSANKPQLVIATSSTNQAPVLAAIGNKTANAGQALTFTATASDPDANQSKTFSLINSPGGANIGSTSGVFNWTPSTAGSYTFTVRVTDNGFPALYDEEQITVTVKTTTNSSVTLSAVADAYVQDGSYAGVNYGKKTSLVVKTSPLSGLSRSTYLKFSLNNVNNVNSAKLRIYGSNTASTANIPIAAYGVTNDSWTETGINWNNRPAASSAVLNSVNVNSQSKYYELDVTSFVKAQLAGDKTASFFLKDPSEKDTYVTFNSRENSTNKPQLVIATSSTNQAPRAENISSPVITVSKTKFYPNPVQEKFIIELSEEYKGNVSLQIVDLLGKTFNISNLRSKKEGFKTEVNISNLSLRSGVYLLKIQSASKSEVIKFIVQ